MIRFTPAQIRAYLDEDEVPDAIACAIDRRLVRQPVCAPGMPQVYEGHALAKWLQRQPTHPVSRAPLQASDMLLAPRAHKAANRFRRLVNVECQRRAAEPTLGAAAAQAFRETGAMHLCMRQRNATLRPPPALPALASQGSFSNEALVARFREMVRERLGPAILDPFNWGGATLLGPVEQPDQPLLDAQFQRQLDEVHEAVRRATLMTLATLNTQL